jgi:hypothetical protein
MGNQRQTRPKNWILTWDNPQFGTVILCRDGMYRKCPHFGDSSDCARQFSSANWALKRVRRDFGDYEAIAIDSSRARALGIGASYFDAFGGNL